MFENYDKKKIVFVVFVSLLLFFLIFAFIGDNDASNKVVLSNDRAIQYDDDTFIIPIERLTDDKAYTDPTEDVQYREDGVKTSFPIMGIYKGVRFSKAHYEWHEDGTYDLLMEIGHEMDPKDGVIQGYMVETFENKTPYVYVYLDEDWKKQVKDTNIIWGLNYDIIQKFKWTKVGDGIYMNKIKDDINRFNISNINSRKNGIIVGDLTLADTKTNVNGDWTAIKLE